jgi:hypothetical protein
LRDIAAPIPRTGQPQIISFIPSRETSASTRDNAKLAIVWPICGCFAQISRGHPLVIRTFSHLRERENFFQDGKSCGDALSYVENQVVSKSCCTRAEVSGHPIAGLQNSLLPHVTFATSQHRFHAPLHTRFTTFFHLHSIRARRNPLMDFLKSAVSAAIAKSASFPYAIGDRVDNDESIWTLSNGTKRVRTHISLNMAPN